MTAIKKLIDGSGSQYYPQTHTKAVVDDYGNSVESVLQAQTDLINQAQMEVGSVPSDIYPTEGSANWATSGGIWSSIHEETHVVTADLLTDVDKTLSNGTIIRTNTPNTWYVTNDYYGYWYHISNYRGKTLEAITGNTTGNCLFAFTTVIESSSGNEVDYASDSAAIIIGGNTKQNMVIPSDANYLYIQTYADGEDRTPQSLKVYGSIKDKLEDVDQIPSKGSTKFVSSGGVYSFEPHAISTKLIDTRKMEKVACSLASGKKWSANGYHCVVECSDGDTFNISVKSDNTGIYYGWLTSDYAQPSGGDTTPYVSGYDRTWVSSGNEPVTLVAPEGAAYLCLVCYTGSYNNIWVGEASVVASMTECIENRVSLAKEEVKEDIEEQNLVQYPYLWVSNDESSITFTEDGDDIVINIINTTGKKRVGFSIESVKVGEKILVSYTANRIIVFGYGETLNSSFVLADSTPTSFYFTKTSASQKYLFIPASSYTAGDVLTLKNFKVYTVIENKSFNSRLSSIEGYAFMPSSYIPIKENYEVYMNIVGSQGSALFGNYIFQSYGNSVSIYDLQNKSLVQTVAMPSFPNSKTHYNTMSFGGTKYDSGDDYPLLYICTGYTDTTSVSTSEVYVVRFVGTAGNYTASLIQTITLDFGITNRWTEFVVDPIKNRAWINGSGIATYVCVNLPDTSVSEVTIGTNTSIIDKFNTKTFTLGTTIKSSGQGRFFYHNRVYWVSGVPSYAGEGAESLYVVVDNTMTHCTEAVVPLSNYGLANGTDNTYEPESCFIWNDDFYVVYRSFVAKLIQNAGEVDGGFYY